MLVPLAGGLVREILSRKLRDRRAVARYAGLTGSPDESGLKRREKGLAKAGNARVRRGLIQLAWRFLMFQKDSALTRWYRTRTEGPSGARKTTMIVALARKLLIANRTADALELTNGISLEVRPASFRKLRGPTYIAVVADELAFWYVDAAYANPDVEILNAVEPGLATTGGPLILASSPHARRGALWDVFKRHYGAGGDPLILVAHGATRALNPSLPQRVVDRALEKDRARATAEYLAQFRTDVEGFVALEAVEACTGDYREMLPAANNYYRAFTDPSGGSDDSFALAISHKSKDRIIIDAIREARPPFSPDAVVDDFAALLKAYDVTKVVGDHYGGEFVKEPFRKHGIAYDLAHHPKSDLYKDLLPSLNSGQTVLPHHDRLVAQPCGLQTRTGRSRRDSIDHAPTG